MEITLTKAQYEELLSLEEGENIEVTFNGIDAYITPDEYGNIEYKGRHYTFNFFCPSEVTLHVKKESKPQPKAEPAVEEPKVDAEVKETPKPVDFSSIKGVFKSQRYTNDVVGGEKTPLRQWVGCVNGEWMLLRTTAKQSVYRSCAVHGIVTQKDGTRKADVSMSQTDSVKSGWGKPIAVVKPILVTY